MKHSEFAASYEVYYFRHDKNPTRAEFNFEFDTSVSEEEWENWTNSPAFLNYLEKRGVVKNHITPKQLELIDKLLDLSIPTLNLRLKAAGVTQQEFIQYKRQPEFRKVLRDRTNALTEEDRFEVIQSLTKRAKEGSVSAQRLWLEMSGDYVPTAKLQGSVHITDTQNTVRQLIEIMQKYISPQTMGVIVAEFESVILGTKALPPPTNNLIEID